MVGPLDRSLYLASRSPRRRELLDQIGVRYRLLMFRSEAGRAFDVNEDPVQGELPADYVLRLARVKAEAGWAALLRRNLPRGPVLSADTTVALGERIFGKPVDRKEAAEMLGALSGQRHQVLTAVALKNEEQLESALSTSEVTFKALTADEIRQYVDSGECDDKAGAYGIQGRAARFVVELRGSYSGVMGLPLYETAELLDKLLREKRNPPA
jgi:septum formation protein